MLQFKGLAEDCNIFHFMTTRLGGVGLGAYASFNLGAFCGDKPEHVTENRKRLCAAIGLHPEDMYVPHQTHGTEIGVIDTDFLARTSEEQAETLEGVDALLTDLPGVGIAVTTADCVPIVLYAPDKEVAGVAHAGWRGTCNGIVAKTVEAMVARYGANPALIRAGIGPCISQEAFEVGHEVVDAFTAAGINLDGACYYNESTGKPHIDLTEVNRRQLIDAGVSEENIETAGICTYTNHNEFFSARRLSIHSGRFLTGIVRTPKTNK